MPTLVSRLCLDLRSDGLYVFTCTKRAGHDGDHEDLTSDYYADIFHPTHWPVAEPLSDRARHAVEFDSDLEASWESRRPTGSELAAAWRAVDEIERS